MDSSLAAAGSTGGRIPWDMIKNMIVRFDDSLPILVRTLVKELGADATSNGVVVRDTSGRLAFFCGAELSSDVVKHVSDALKAALGAYARSDRPLADVKDIGGTSILQSTVALPMVVSGHSIHLIDRRLVGADWLRVPAPQAPPPPRFVFASLKGGVGRSTALSVAAAHFASQGRRMLAIDLDMEAPGLGAMLLDDGTLPEFGLIDALVENGISELDERFYADLVGPSGLAHRRGRIDVIPAFGRRSISNPSDVLAKIARAYAEDVAPDGSIATILDQVASLVDHYARTSRYDGILVDCRAGLHETTASAILGLGAEVYLFGLDERQTFQGYLALLAHLARFLTPHGSGTEWLTRITMVQGRAPANIEARRHFADSCKDLFRDAGLDSRIELTSPVVPLPAEPFRNVPWADEAEDVDLSVESDLQEPIAILDDERFRLFEPIQRSDLLSERVYQASFGELLDRMGKAFPDPSQE